MKTDPRKFETVKSSLTDSETTLGEKAPGAPFAVVALSYLAVLALACAVIVSVIWLSR